MHRQCAAAKPLSTRICYSLLLLSLFLLHMGQAHAQQSNGDNPSSQVLQAEDLSNALGKSLTAERQELDELKERLGQVRTATKTLDTEITAYKVIASAYSNLLHRQTPIEELKKVRAELETIIQDIASRLVGLTDNLEIVRKLNQEEKQQYDYNNQQLAIIKKTATGTREGKAILDQLQALNKTISEQLQTTSNMEAIYLKSVGQLTEVQESIDSLAKNYDRQIEEKQKEDLFSRNENVFISIDWEEISRDLQKIVNVARQVSASEFWVKQLRNVWKAGGLLFIKALLLFVIVQFLIFRLRKLCAAWRERLQERRPWLCLTLDLFRQSSPLAGTVLFLYGYVQLQDVTSGFPFIWVIIDSLLAWLLTRWVLDLAKLIRSSNWLQVPQQLLTGIRGLMLAIRSFAVPYLVLQWNLGTTSIFLALARIGFELYLIIWTVHFWRRVQYSSANSVLTSSKQLSTLRTGVIGWGYCVGLGGFLLELAGYGQLALYWYASWGRSIVVAIWAALLLLALLEWNHSVTLVPLSERKETHHAGWLLIRLLGVIWLGFLTAFLMMAWGATKAMVLGFFHVLNQSIELGEIRLNLLGIAYAFLILAFTLAATRFWRPTLKKRILTSSGLEEGLQESVATLSVYVLWMLGILAALHALGVSSTSLAVVFGALGIGLGFGLQNIFNNFISGIILLFERPIQVGEVIEIGGKWGTVNKINFRSTVVQTYDNASLIIPNSDFISSQVVNWSFKDPRLRRSVTVGVAYGSDVQRVKDTLLEIANNHPKVLKYPKYDVLFSDFGDSALVFDLRFWSTLTDFFAVETEIRFEIDRLFREREIEISFPQRDIHIRTITPELSGRLKKDEPDNKN